ncbi:hypothetical protein [Peribacillus huizhouensis]|uniref:Lipoprotein n=1 Tax=Peribacillus huizhouensis TaxID=1501239 RepID=A0ABR6CV04_9BACI|nr:hypothetical protein [Peribacillus huizhouensis]MBA9028440.1 hypothetical protein [Peribacillus huizhouensis]
MSLLSACNLGNNEVNDQDDGVNYRPVRYEKDNNDVLDNRTPLTPSRDFDPTDVRFDRDNNFGINNNRDTDIDLEPSEERKGY